MNTKEQIAALEAQLASLKTQRRVELSGERSELMRRLREIEREVGAVDASASTTAPSAGLRRWRGGPTLRTRIAGYVAANPGARFGDIAKHTGKGYSYVVRAVTEMVRDGELKRSGYHTQYRYSVPVATNGSGAGVDESHADGGR